MKGFNEPLNDDELLELESSGTAVMEGRAAREIKRLRGLLSRGRALVKDAFASSWSAPRTATNWIVELDNEAI